MTNLTLKGSSYRVVNLVYVARERQIERCIERERERYIERDKFIYIYIYIYIYTHTERFIY